MMAVMVVLQGMQTYVQPGLEPVSTPACHARKATQACAADAAVKLPPSCGPGPTSRGIGRQCPLLPAGRHSGQEKPSSGCSLPAVKAEASSAPVRAPQVSFAMCVGISPGLQLFCVDVELIIQMVNWKIAKGRPRL
jgi:hypothetical protein